MINYIFRYIIKGLFVFSLGWITLSNFLFGQQCNILYVSPNGAISGTKGEVGTQDNPADINYAITLLTPEIRHIFLANGLYELRYTFPIESGVILEGGFDESKNWSKSNKNYSLIIRKAVNFSSDPLRLVAFDAVNKSGFRIQDIRLVVESVDKLSDLFSGISIYGIRLQECSEYIINRCQINVGNAANGINGTNASTGRNGGNGSIGNQGEEDGGCCRDGGSGGNTWSNGVVAGGNGGRGGEQGKGPNPFPPGKAYNGDKGGSGGGINGSDGGNGGVGNTTLVSTGCDNDGKKGMDGAAGNKGRDGRGRSDAPQDFDGISNNSKHENGFFIPGNGTDGRAGENGGGGGGGGGGGSQGGQIVGSNNGSGAGGGGGGEGGEGAKGGMGGGGGGGVFGIYLFENGTKGTIKYTTISKGTFGKGGRGGIGGVGGIGGFGGFGGATGKDGQPVACDIGRGGDGGGGGKGGDGGFGGSGVDGEAFNIYTSINSKSPNLDSLDLSNAEEPIVSINYSGCSSQTLEFEYSSSGEVFWFFGEGADPVSAMGPRPKVKYHTPGRKTINIIANGIPYSFSDYITLRQDGASTNPKIKLPANTFCTGSSVYFASDILALKYRWKFSHLYSIIESENAREIDSVQFNVPGEYKVELQTYSNCCGWSDPAIEKLTVIPGKGPSIRITPLNETDKVCQNQMWTAIASYDHAGDSPELIWFKNNIAISEKSSILRENNWKDGDEIKVGMITTSPCSFGDTIFSNKIKINVLGLPKIAQSGDCIEFSNLNGKTTFSPYENIIFKLSDDNDSTETYIWDFGNGKIGLGRSTVTQFTQSGKYKVSVVRVNSEKCESEPCITEIFIDYQTVADFKLENADGCTPLKVNFLNSSTNAIAFEWDFGDQTPINNEINPQHIYSSAGKYTVSLLAIGKNNSDSIIRKEVVVANPSPLADITCITTYIDNSRDSVKFMSNARGAVKWFWDFGDLATVNDTSNLPNPIYYYPLEGKYTVKLVVTNENGCIDEIIKENFILKRINFNNRDYSNKNGYKIYPNPADNNFLISIPGITGCTQLDIVDLQGKNILSQELISGDIKIETINWPDGVYFILLKLENGEIQRTKICIKH